MRKLTNGNGWSRDGVYLAWVPADRHPDAGAPSGVRLAKTHLSQLRGNSSTDQVVDFHPEVNLILYMAGLTSYGGSEGPPNTIWNYC